MSIKVEDANQYIKNANPLKVVKEARLKPKNNK
jgi:hypothetical protein